MPHPRPYEWEVQAFLRHQKPPVGGESRLVLGTSDELLRAMFVLSRQPVYEGVGYVKLQAIAVSLEDRRKGGLLADQTLTRALVHCFNLAAAEDVDRVRVVAWVDPQNEPSKRMLHRAGFGLVKLVGAGLEDWQLELHATSDGREIRSAEPLEKGSDTLN